jgi:hypothetical protein
MRGDSYLEDAMKKPVRRKPRFAAAGSWLIPIALTAAAVVSIARFSGDVYGDAAASAAASPSITRAWSQPTAKPENGAREGAHRGGPF